MIRKLLIISGCITLLAAVLAGCGGGKDSSGTTPVVAGVPISPQQPAAGGKNKATTPDPRAKPGITAGACMGGTCAIVHKKAGWKVSAPPKSGTASPLPQPQTISKSLDGTCQMILFTSPPQSDPPEIAALSGQFGVVAGKGYKQIGKGLYLLPVSKVKMGMTPTVSPSDLVPKVPDQGRVVSVSQVGIRYLTRDGKKYAVPLSLTTTPKKTKPCSSKAIKTAQKEITGDLTFYLKSAGV